MALTPSFRRVRPAVAALLAVVAAALVMADGPTVAEAGGDPAPFVVESDVVDVYSSHPSGVRVDRWIVWICAIEPGGPTAPVPLTPEEAAAVFDARLAPYFVWLSEGAYRPEFTAGGTLPAGTDDVDFADCSADAIAAPASAGFAGAVVITDAPGGMAYAESGHMDCASPPCVGATTLPANQRYATLGADNVVVTPSGQPDLATSAHEIGHALDWGHASASQSYRTDQPGETGYGGTVDPEAPWIDDLYFGYVENFDAGLARVIPGTLGLAEARAAVPPGPLTCDSLPPMPGFTICALFGGLEYGNVTDVMGSTPTPLSDDRTAIPQTQVFNRYAAGWVSPDDVETHAGSFAEYDVAPIGVDGTEMVVLPTHDPRRFVTIEGRSDSSFLAADQLRSGAENSGVLLHLVDQRPDACGVALCWGDTGWKTMVAAGTPWTFGHVLAPGESTSVDGVAVEVVSLNADGTYTIRIGDAPPAADPDQAVVPTPIVRSPSFTG